MPRETPGCGCCEQMYQPLACPSSAFDRRHQAVDLTCSGESPGQISRARNNEVRQLVCMSVACLRMWGMFVEPDIQRPVPGREISEEEKVPWTAEDMSRECHSIVMRRAKISPRTIHKREKKLSRRSAPATVAHSEAESIATQQSAADVAEKANPHSGASCICLKAAHGVSQLPTLHTCGCSLAAVRDQALSPIALFVDAARGRAHLTPSTPVY
jgi:hypothetical protein